MAMRREKVVIEFSEESLAAMQALVGKLERISEDFRKSLAANMKAASKSPSGDR